MMDAYISAVLDFLAMGKYAAYVWPSYGLSALVLVVLWITSLRGLRSTEAEFDRLKAVTGALALKQKQKMETSDGDEA
jgi:heme exporter protein D